MKTEVREYIETNERVSDLVSERELIQAKTIASTQEIERRFNAEIARIREEIGKMISNEKEWEHKEVSKINSTITELMPQLEIFRQKIHYLQEKENIESQEEARVREEEIKPYRDRELMRVEDFHKDKYLHIVLFIAENDKPKNKYSLLAYGRSKFAVFLDSHSTWYSYGMPLNDSNSGCFLKRIIKDAPTKEELQEYLRRHRGTLLSDFMFAYEVVKCAYFQTTENYALEDLKPALEIQEIPDEAAPIICRITTYATTRTSRLYRSFFFESVEKMPEEFDSFEYIKVDGDFFKKSCRKEQMTITQTGNTLFGDWWSTHIEKGNPLPDTVFNKENWERILGDVEKWIEEKNKLRRPGKEIDLGPPKVEWVHPELL